MTGFNQVVGRISEDNAAQLGTDHFEVTYHRGARPTHQPWQGRVYTKEELVTVCGYGEVTGLKGANCYHDFHPFFPDISKRLYTDEQLDKMNAEENTPKEYKGRDYTAYEATQRQRSMESRLRRRREEIHLLEKGGASEDDILAAKAKYHALSDEYAEFSKAFDLPQQRERINIQRSGGVDVSFGKPLEKPEKPVAKSGESGIIKLKDNSSVIHNKDISKYVNKPITETDNQSIREWYVANVNNIPNMIDKSLSREEQAKQAFELRNKFKREARIAMSDKETSEMLERKRPVPTFEELVESKMKRKGMTRKEAIEDILKTASSTNADVNKEFGL